MKPTPLIAIVGPTASGKTALGLQLAEEFGGEIIAADSRTVYRGMDIGTAKPTEEEQSRVRHHLLDIVEPDTTVSVAALKRMAAEVIAELAGKGKIPFLVGGSGLYVDSVLYDFSFPPAPDAATRARLAAMDLGELQQELRRVDPNALDLIDLSNPRRVIRAIETAGMPRARKPLRDNTLVLGLSLDKEVIRERIMARAKQMLDDGLLDEAARLGLEYGWGVEALRSSAYAAVRETVLGRASVEEGFGKIVASDLRLVKKQMTWFRRNPDIVWLTSPEEAREKVAAFLAAKEDSPRDSS